MFPLLSQEYLVLRSGNGPFQVVAGEGPDRVEGLPEGEHRELGAIAVSAAQQVGGHVPGGSPAPRKGGLPEVLGVGVGVPGPSPAAPHAGDHGLCCGPAAAPHHGAADWLLIDCVGATTAAPH